MRNNKLNGTENQLNTKLTTDARIMQIYLNQYNEAITFSIDGTEHSIPRMAATGCVKYMTLSDDLSKLHLTIYKDGTTYARTIPLESYVA